MNQDNHDFFFEAAYCSVHNMYVYTTRGCLKLQIMIQTYILFTKSSTCILLCTGWRRRMGCLMFTRHYPQKSPIISDSFAENDLHLKGSFKSSPHCTRACCSLHAPHCTRACCLLHAPLSDTHAQKKNSLLPWFIKKKNQYARLLKIGSSLGKLPAVIRKHAQNFRRVELRFGVLESCC